MRSHICNATLGEAEVKFNSLFEEWDPCSRCLAIIGEVFEPMSEEEIDEALENEEEFHFLEESP